MGYLDEDPSVVIPPTPGPAPAAPTGLYAPTPSIGELYASKIGNVNNIGRYALNAPGAAVQDTVGGILAQDARGLGVLGPTERDTSYEAAPGKMGFAVAGLDASDRKTLSPALAPKSGMAPGMGVGGGVGSGPSMQGQVDAAQQARLAGMTKERDAQGRLGVAAADRNEWTAEMEEADAERAGQVYKTQEELDADVNKGVDDFFQTNAKMAHDISTSKVDSNRLFKNANAAQSVTMGIGAVLGGMLAGLNGGPNQFMQSVERMVDRDVADQQSAIEGKRSGLQARQNMYGQLLQQTGDRHLAAMQLKNLQLEALKQKTAAKAKALGTPEVLANSDKLIAGIEQNQALVQEQMAQRKVDQIRAAQAAAAAAAAAREKMTWERQKDVAEMGLKRDQLEVEKMKALGMTPGDINKETQAISKEMSDKDLAQGRTAVEQAKQQLARTPSDQGLPGVGLWGDVKAGLPLGLDRLALSDQEKINRQNWDSIKLQYQSQITGSGASEKEREMLSKAFEGAKTAAEQRNAIAKADAFFQQREQRVLAGYSPQAVAAYKQRLAGGAGKK